MGDLLESGEPWFAAAEALLVGVAVALAIGLALRLLARRLLGDEDRAQRVSMLAFWGIVVVFGLVAVARLLGGESAEAGLTVAGNRFFSLLPDVVVALVLLVVGSVLATAARNAVLRRLAPRRRRLADPAAALVGVGVMVVAVLLSARQVGIATGLVDGLLLVAVGAGLLGLGLAAGLGGRGMAAALAATQHTRGILTVGDVIEVDGLRGRVLRLGATAVRLDLDDGTTAEVPNTHLLERTVVVFEHVEPPAAPDRAPAEGGATRAEEEPSEAPTRTIAAAPGPASEAPPQAPARQVPAPPRADAPPVAPAPQAADAGSASERDPTRTLSRAEIEQARAEQARRARARPSGRDDDDGPPTEILAPEDRPDR